MILAAAAAGMFALSILAGMLGIGVAFAAVPFLGLFLDDLVHEIQPLSLLLNGVTAAFSAIAFAHARIIPWRRSLIMATVTSIASPIGAYLAASVPATILWSIYFVAVLFAIARMARIGPAHSTAEQGQRFSTSGVLAIPISLLSGLIGVGPGFLLVPAMQACGIPLIEAAAINAVAVTPASLLSLVPHVGHSQVEWSPALTMVFAGACGGLVGAKLSASVLSERTVRAIFVVAMVAVAFAKLIQLAYGA